MKRTGIRLDYAFASLLVHSFFAGTKQLAFHVSEVPVTFGPWLHYPAGKTWLYSFYAQLPVDIVQAVIFAGTESLAVKIFGGTGSFEGQFAIYAFAFTPVNVLLILGTWLLSATGLSDSFPWADYFVAVLAWNLSIIALSVQVEQVIGAFRASVYSAIGIVPTVLFALTYVR
ncbi:MAG: hypothetical protein HXY20_08780 [Acidobacteria bacterium]|nr:hypothetical protein [Acidobacteriota bacterium]